MPGVNSAALRLPVAGQKDASCQDRVKDGQSIGLCLLGEKQK